MLVLCGSHSPILGIFCVHRYCSLLADDLIRFYHRIWTFKKRQILAPIHLLSLKKHKLLFTVSFPCLMQLLTVETCIIIICTIQSLNRFGVPLGFRRRNTFLLLQIPLLIGLAHHHSARWAAYYSTLAFLKAETTASLGSWGQFMDWIAFLNH